MQMDVTQEYDAELVQKYFLEFLTTKKIIYDSRRGIRLTGEQFWSQILIARFYLMIKVAMEITMWYNNGNRPEGTAAYVVPQKEVTKDGYEHLDGHAVYNLDELTRQQRHELLARKKQDSKKQELEKQRKEEEAREEKKRKRDSEKAAKSEAEKDAEQSNERQASNYSSVITPPAPRPPPMQSTSSNRPNDSSGRSRPVRNTPLFGDSSYIDTDYQQSSTRLLPRDAFHPTSAAFGNSSKGVVPSICGNSS